MDRIDPKEVSKTYNSIEEIWNLNDKWHWTTHEMIKSFIWKSLNKIPNYKYLKILNAGSAGNSYDICENQIIHLDIAQKKIAHLSNSILSNIEDIPIRNNTFDLIICVGSVINYCDPIRVFQEFNRLLMRQGYIIIEFESSCTLELLGKRKFNKNIVLTDTFYNGSIERLWYYSERFIKEIAANFNLQIYAQDKCHMLSPLVYRLFKNEKYAAGFSKYDKIILRIPLVNRLASNVIFLFKKI
ncbi:MAG: methyltransferase domain-containing protein [Ignavibacteriaceae bacterium]|jgi:ubiquinone/menaquinone biosynthesis C-methylase UbiE